MQSQTGVGLLASW